MRILLFLATNAAILVVISVVFQIFGIEGILQENGVDLDLKALLILSAVIGFGGSFSTPRSQTPSLPARTRTMRWWR